MQHVWKWNFGIFCTLPAIFKVNRSQNLLKPPNFHFKAYIFCFKPQHFPVATSKCATIQKTLFMHRFVNWHDRDENHYSHHYHQDLLIFLWRKLELKVQAFMWWGTVLFQIPTQKPTVIRRLKNVRKQILHQILPNQHWWTNGGRI